MVRALMARPAVAQFLPVRQLGHDRRPLGPDVWTWPCRGCGAAGCRRAPRRAATGNGWSAARWPTPRGAVGMPRNVMRRPASGASVEARISARCTVRTPARSRRQPAADVHQARGVTGGADLGAGGEHAPHLVGQHRGRRVRVLHRERAAEPAADVGVRQRHQVDAGDRRRSRSGRSPTRSSRSE